MYNELTYILSDPQIPLQLKLHMAGITLPDPHYRMNRWNSPCAYYIFESIVSGYGVLETPETTYYLEPGDAYLIPAGSVCEYQSAKHDPWTKIWFNVSGELISSLCNLYQLNTIKVFKQIKLNDTFRQTLDIIEHNRSNAYSEFALALHNIINKFYIFQQQKEHDHTSQEAVELKKFLDIAWRRKITQQELCELISKSPAQMQRIFKAAWGMSPGQYVQQKRLKTAIQYLENTNFTIRRIAEHTGFSNEYYFANWFKEKTGYAPKSYRPLASADKLKQE